MEDYRQHQRAVLRTAVELWPYVSRLGTPEALENPESVRQRRARDIMQRSINPETNTVVDGYETFATRTAQIDAFWYGKDHITIFELAEHVNSYISNYANDMQKNAETISWSAHCEKAKDIVSGLFERTVRELTGDSPCEYKAGGRIREDLLPTVDTGIVHDSTVRLAERIFNIIGRANTCTGPIDLDFDHIPSPTCLSHPFAFPADMPKDAYECFSKTVHQLSLYWEGNVTSPLLALSRRIGADCDWNRYAINETLAGLGLIYGIPEKDIKISPTNPCGISENTLGILHIRMRPYFKWLTDKNAHANKEDKK